MARTALVLGGGGITGIAWELGLLLGLTREGIDLTGSDVVVGTSAGSFVGAQITGTRTLEELYAAQFEPPDQSTGGRFSRLALLSLVPAYVVPGTGRQRMARVGRQAMRAHPPGTADRVPIFRAALDDAWPADRDLRITAVRVEDGAAVVLDRESGVDLPTAVAASCAVPMVWPPVAVAEGPMRGHYVDGGMRSTANVDRAGQADRLVVLAPLPQSLGPGTSIRSQLRRVAPTSWSVVKPDEQALAAFGRNLLDPARRADAAREGLRQADGLVEEMRQVWLG